LRTLPIFAIAQILHSVPLMKVDGPQS
jgi:hypothetical protein